MSHETLFAIDKAVCLSPVCYKAIFRFNLTDTSSAIAFARIAAHVNARSAGLAAAAKMAGATE